MKRSLFFTISAVIAFIFGLPSLLMPVQATEMFGISITSEISLIVRSLGGMIFSMGMLYILIRKEPDSKLMHLVLLYSTIAHTLGFAVSIYGAVFLMPADKLAPNIGAHLFMGVGSLYYYRRMNKS